VFDACEYNRLDGKGELRLEMELILLICLILEIIQVGPWNY
jgi:hypothetical protein